MPRTTRRPAASVVVAWCAIACTLVLGAPSPVRATTVSPFAPRFSTNDNGAITIVGNSVLTCPPSATCTTAQTSGGSGAASSNNGYSMVYIDQDGSAFPDTFDSSSATLALPAGATVLFAGLYWGARQAGSSGGNTANPIGQMSLRLPGEAAYRTVASNVTFGPTDTSDHAYQQFADVTALVGGAGAGEYWGANVAAGLGTDRYGGWSLAVAYRDPTQPLRNLTVFDGFSDVGVNSSETIDIAGFLAPLTGTVDARLGMVAYEGDRGGTGDQAFLNDTRLATAVSGGSNFFNGANDEDGKNVTARQPAYVNMLGFDIKQLGVPGAIPNGATSARVELSTVSERYFIGVVTTGITVYAPDFSTSRKAVANLSGHDPAAVGDVLEYTSTFSNTGGDPAESAVMSDPLPPGTTYVPGSLQVVSGANAGAKTDAADADQAEYDAGTRTVRVRLGTGASGTAGGEIAPGASTSVRFRVTVGAAAPGTTLANVASLGYVAGTLGTALTYVTNRAETPVAANADLAITKTTTPNPAVAGADVTSTIVVTNNGPNAATAVTVTDTVEPGVAPTGASPAGCAIAGQAVSCALGTVAAGASVTVTVTGRAPPTSTVTSSTDVARVTSTTIDPDPSDNAATATVAVVRRAALVVTKTANPATVTPGATVTFPITVTNNGPSTAVAARLADTLDARFTGVSAPAPCQVQANAVQCPLGDLAPGASASTTIAARLLPSVTAGTVIPNTATASTTTPTTGGASATTSVTAGAAQADLAITKTVAPTSVIAGNGGASYGIDVVNNGPSDATNVSITDLVPPGLTVRDITSARGTCLAGPPVTCTVGLLPAGGRVSVDVDVDVEAGASAGPAVNTAQVGATQTDPVPTNNTSTATLSIGTSADLFTMKAGDATLVPGGSGTYRIDVGNAGPSTARDVGLTDPFPAGITVTNVAAPTGSCDTLTTGAPLRCALGDIAAGDSAEVVVTYDVDDAYAATTLVNTATASSPTPDPDPDDNVSTFTASTEPQADVTVVKQLTTDVVAGDTVAWDLVGRNNGPSAAADVVVTDVLPAGLEDVTVPAACTLADRTVTCAVGALAAGAPSATFTISATVPAATPDGSALDNTASVSSSTPDPALSNNRAAVHHAVATSADLVVVKTTDTPSAPAGAGLPTFTVNVTNDGPSVARDVRLVDDLPFDAIIETVTPAGCTAQGVDVDCDLDDLDPGESVDVVITYYTRTSVTPGSYTNRATASSSTPDPDSANDTDSVTVTVLAPSVDVTVDKTGPAEVVAGGRFDYSIDVQNGGPSTAFDVVVTDVLPAGFVPDSATTEFGSCTVAGQTVTCQLPFVYETPFEEFNAPILVSGAVAPDAPASVTNTATAVTVEPDSDPDSNSSSITTAVRRESSVSITKEADAATFVAGGTAPYTITVTNAGPSAADGATVTDALPAGVDFLAEESDPGCALVAGSVSCALGSIEPNTSVVMRLTGRIDPNATVTALTNTASFSSTATDPDPSDDSASVTTPLVLSANLTAVKSATSDTVAAGGIATFNITATNEGPSTAHAAELLDTLPAGTTLVDIETVPDLSCVAAACTIGDLLPGASVTAIVRAAVPPSQPAGTITNTVIVTSPTPDPDIPARTAHADIEVVAQADIAVVKTLATNPIVAGLPVTYDFVVTNRGPSDAVNVTVVDPFPPGTSFAGAIPPPNTTCELSADDVPTVSCRLASLPVGQSVTGTLTLSTDAALTGTLSNTTIIGSDALDVDDSDNVSTAAAPIVAADSQVDLAVTKSGPAELVAGETFAYTVTVANHGVSLSTAASVVDVLPAGLVPTAATVDGAVCAIAGQTVTCPVGALLPGGAASAIAISGTVDAALTAGPLTNTASATPVGTETNPGDNTATTTAAVAHVNDIGVDVRADADRVAAGADAGFTVVVTNNGPSVANAVVVTAELPALLADAAISEVPDGSGTLRLAAIVPPHCTVSGAVVTCPLGDLRVGEAVTLDVGGRIPADAIAGTTLRAAGSVSAAGTDTVTVNNQDDAVIVVVARVGGGSLPITGFAAIGVAAIAALLLAIGVAMRLAGRPARRPR